MNSATVAAFRAQDPAVMELARQPGGVDIVDEDGRVVLHLSIPSTRLECDDPDCKDALEAARAEMERFSKLLPDCLGEWTGGSGGHRKYAPGCERPGVWDIGVGFVCDAHKNKNGGDDDAWIWWEERDRLEAALEAARAEVERLTACLAKANTNHEHFERQWYLMTDERDAAIRERDLYGDVYGVAASLRTFPVPFDDHWRLVGEVDKCRAALGALAPAGEKEREESDGSGELARSREA